MYTSLVIREGAKLDGPTERGTCDGWAVTECLEGPLGFADWRDFAPGMASRRPSPTHDLA